MEQSQSSQRIQPAHHEHHYKRTVIIVAIFLGLVIVAAVVYQFAITKNGTQRDDRLRMQYQAEQAKQAKQVYATVQQHANDPVTEEGTKAFDTFFKASAKSKTDPQESAAHYQQLQEETEAAFQAWKANR